jgi:acetylornithine/N-succinyldiaminopimelate aminotransferase
VDGFDHVPFNNLNTLRAAITPQTAGVLIEPIQGEGGIRPAATQFLRDLRATCDEFGILLGLDEVQTGMGRTGKLFAHEWAGIEPDVMSLAKGLAGGFPMGAVLAKERVAKALVPGSHGTTFGGGPLACAAGNAVLDVILAPGFLDEVIATGQHLWAGLEKLCAQYPAVFTEVRGSGLLVGLKCTVSNIDLQNAALAEGLLTIAAGDNVLRLAPPLIVRQAECDEALARLERAARLVQPATMLEAAK